MNKLITRSACYIGLSLLLSSCNMTANGVNFGKLAEVGNRLTKTGPMSLEQELSLGDQFSAVLLGAARLHPNEKLQNYVNQTGLWLALQSSRPDLPWTFAVLDTPAINAFAVPGGYVFITAGLLDQLQTEAELAAVLSHEIIHVTARHHIHEMERINSVELLTTIGSAANEYYQENHQGNNNLANRQIAESVLNAGHTLYSKGLNKDDELAADQQGAALAAAAGYDPYALPAVIQILDSASAEDSNLSLLLATHPKPENRLKELQQPIEQLAAQHPAAQELASRFQQRVHAK